MRKSIFFITLLAAFALSGCQKADQPKFLGYDAKPAKFADADQVENCQRIGELTAKPSTTKASSNYNLTKKNARDNLLQKAGEMGATHVLFMGYIGNRRPVAQGLAFKCP